MVEEILSRQGSEEVCIQAFLIKGKQVLLGLRTYKEGSFWISVGGRSQPNETLGMTLRREIFEEVGITQFSLGRYLGSKEGYKSGDVVHFVEIFSDQEPIRKELDKFICWKWFEIEEVPGNLLDSKDIQFIRKCIES